VNTKMIAIASLIFALLFIAIFMATYNRSKGLLGNVFNGYFADQKSGQMLNVDYWNGKKVTSRTIQDLKDYIDVYKVYDPSLSSIKITQTGSSKTSYDVTVIKEGTKIKEIKFT
jgi:hypothetical protein